MVGDLRAEVGAGEVPFVAGELGEFLRRETKAGQPSFWPIVNEQINALPKHVRHAAAVSSQGLKHKGDEVHFDSAGLREFGRRYAAAMLKLQGKVPQKTGSAGRPNILFIVADDLGWRDVGWHGSTFQTPTLDKLVREGVELDRHYVQPVCSPTRTALLSGRWTSRWGSHVLSPTNLRAFPPGTITLASALQQCGYETHIAGKWHLGSKPEWGPNHYGFDHSYGSLNGAVDPWTHKYRKGPYEDTWHRDLQRLDEEGNATELVGKEVVQWIRQKKSPWLIYVPFHAVHIPVDAPDEYKRRYEGIKFHDDPVKDESLRRLAAMVSQLDAKVGQFLAALGETGQRENTLIVFTSDNGGKTKGGKNPYVGDVADSPVLSSNAPLRGEKASLFEGGVRVAAFANWPGKLTPGKLTAPLHAADWMPTLTALAGWNGVANAQFDGIDAWPLLTGEQKQPTPRTIYIPLPRAAAVLHDGWKLISSQKATGTQNQLFNVTADPSEQHNLAAEQPQRLARLLERLRELRQGDVTGIPADLQGFKP
jgi:arylsulfatase A-like enzyme